MRKTISLPNILSDIAENKAERMGYSSFSDYIQELIRRDNADAFSAPAPELRETPPNYGGPSKAEQLAADIVNKGARRIAGKKAKTQ